jgi:hypothetical protein
MACALVTSGCLWLDLLQIKPGIDPSTGLAATSDEKLILTLISAATIVLATIGHYASHVVHAYKTTSGNTSTQRPPCVHPASTLSTHPGHHGPTKTKPKPRRFRLALRLKRGCYIFSTIGFTYIAAVTGLSAVEHGRKAAAPAIEAGHALDASDNQISTIKSDIQLLTPKTAPGVAVELLRKGDFRTEKERLSLEADKAAYASLKVLRHKLEVAEASRTQIVDRAAASMSSAARLLAMRGVPAHLAEAAMPWAKSLVLLLLCAGISGLSTVLIPVPDLSDPSEPEPDPVPVLAAQVSRKPTLEDWIAAATYGPDFECTRQECVQAFEVWRVRVGADAMSPIKVLSAASAAWKNMSKRKNSNGTNRPRVYVGVKPAE